MIRKFMIRKFIKILKEDKELYCAYQSNIAMSFVDACHSYKKKNNKKVLSNKDIHQCANNAAQNFLNLLVKVK